MRWSPWPRRRGLNTAPATATVEVSTSSKPGINQIGSPDLAVSGAELARVASVVGGWVVPLDPADPAVELGLGVAWLDPAGARADRVAVELAGAPATEVAVEAAAGLACAVGRVVVPGLRWGLAFELGFGLAFEPGFELGLAEDEWCRDGVPWPWCEWWLPRGVALTTGVGVGTGVVGSGVGVGVGVGVAVTVGLGVGVAEGLLVGRFVGLLVAAGLDVGTGSAEAAGPVTAHAPRVSTVKATAAAPAVASTVVGHDRGATPRVVFTSPP